MDPPGPAIKGGGRARSEVRDQALFLPIAEAGGFGPGRPPISLGAGAVRSRRGAAGFGLGAGAFAGRADARLRSSAFRPRFPVSRFAISASSLRAADGPCGHRA